MVRTILPSNQLILARQTEERPRQMNRQIG